DTARELLLRAVDLGLTPFGLSFHVGSQQVGPEAHEAAIAQAAMLFDELENAGVSLELVNLGGGFPTRYLDEAPGIEAFGPQIERALRFHF
ncbi:ornithine decarboxylase, partial [Staphylococcus aureus]